MAIWAGRWGRSPIDDDPLISSLICSLEATDTATLLIISLEKCLEIVHGKSYVTLTSDLWENPCSHLEIIQLQ